MPERENNAPAANDDLWQVTVMSDPVTSADYISLILAMILGQPRKSTIDTVMDIHTEGSCVVVKGDRAECERAAFLLASSGIFTELKKVGASV